MLNFIKRAVLSIKRRKNQTILLFLIVFMLGNFISISFAIQNTTNKLKDNIKSGLGAIVTIHAKPDMDLYEDNEYYDEIFNILDELNNDERVKYIGYAQESISFDSKEYTNIYFNTIYSSYVGRVMRGVNCRDFLELYQNDIVLIEGRTFTEEEINQGKNVIIVPQGTAIKKDSCLLKDEDSECEKKEIEKVKIGDKITFNRLIHLVPSGLLSFSYDDYPVFEYGSVEYEVIGIYNQNSPNEENSFWYNISTESYSSGSYSEIYTPIKTLIKEIETQNEYKREYYKKHPNIEKNESFNYIQYVQIMINDPTELNKFTSDVRQMLGEAGIHEVNVYNSSDSYDAVAGSIESLSEVSNLFIIVSIIVSMVILGLVITLIIKDRKQEMGIYLSLGENKKKIISQIFLEMYIVGMLSVSLSLFSGDIFGQKLSENIIIKQNEKQEEIIQEKLDLLGAVVPEGLDIGTITDTIESNLNIKYVISIYSVSTLVFVIAIIFPSIYILKLEPKKIMM